jgi:hypothetical protein
MQPATDRRQQDDRLDRFQVERWVDAIGGLVERLPGFWRFLGNFETRRLALAIAKVEIAAPIFVCGLARSGTTILLECLAAHPDTVTHRYRDYPGVLAPVFWNRIATSLYPDTARPVERAHGDGIAVTPDSPEAVAEMLWMAFHEDCHNPAHDNRVGPGDLDPAFTAFFRDHIRKLLWLRGGRRYVSKGNYDLARMSAMIELFPGARFIVPIRDPVTQIASLMRQQALFSAGETRHPAALRYMQRIGHFEFGIDRRPLNLGNGPVTADVQRLWRQGREVEGWSLYWADVHGFLADQLETDAGIRQAAFLVRHETLCSDPRATLQRIFTHADLPIYKTFLTECAERINTPRNQPSPFDEHALQTIRTVTADSVERIARWVPEIVDS